MVAMAGMIFLVYLEAKKEEGDKSDVPSNANGEKDVEKDKEFDIDEATRDSAVVEASDNPYYVSADLNALEVSIHNLFFDLSFSRFI